MYSITFLDGLERRPLTLIAEYHTLFTICYLLDKQGLPFTCYNVKYNLCLSQDSHINAKAILNMQNFRMKFTEQDFGGN